MVILISLSITTMAIAGPVPNNFAYGIPLQVEKGNAVYGFSLPIDVYKGITRNDLSDICVFNGNGEIVPYSLQRPASEKGGPNEFAPLPIFPLLGKPEQSLDGLSLQVKKDRSGSIINVNTNDKNVSAPKVIAYLIDGSKLDKPLSALDLELEPIPEGAIFSVVVESSDDLERWSTRVSGATIASLNYKGHNIDKRTVEIGSVKAKYFRVSLAGTNEMVKIKGVNAKIAAQAVEQPRQWLTATAQVQGDKPGEYTFDLTGLMPVDRIKVLLPEMNTLVRAAFYSRASEKDPWLERGSATLYRLRKDGSEIISPDLAISITPDRFWLMRVDNSGGGLGRGIPKLAAGWIPYRLIFVPRGNGPFTLAYGSGINAGTCSAGSNYLLPELTEGKKEKVTIWPATAGRQEILGGDSALRKQVPLNIKQMVLWGVLGLGVLLLAWMAIRLYKQMNVHNS